MLFLVSGGSALDLLDLIDVDSFDKRFTISVLDERYGSDLISSNFWQFKQTGFYRKLLDKEINYIDTQAQAGESLDDLSNRFEESLRQWRNSNLRGIVVIIQGIGEDGHTAGILPFINKPGWMKDLFANPGRWVVGYKVDKKINKYTQRVTTNFNFLKNVVDYSIVYAVGARKRTVLENIFKPNESLMKTPAAIIRAMENVAIYTDINLKNKYAHIF